MQMRATMRQAHPLEWLTSKQQRWGAPAFSEHTADRKAKGQNRFWKTAWQFLTKSNIHLAYALGIQPREMKTYVYTKTSARLFQAVLFI